MDEYKEVPTKENDEEKASFLSTLFYCYVHPILRTGYKRPLKKQDFCRAKKDDQSEASCELLEKNWDEQLKAGPLGQSYPNLGKAIYKSFGKKYWICGIFFFNKELIFMSRLIQYFQFCSEVSTISAYLYALGFSLATFGAILVHYRPYHNVLRIAMRLRMACGALIYKKSLKLSANILRETEVGKIVNLLSNDVARFDQVVLFLHFLWVAPVSLVFYITLAWYEIGASCLVGFLALLILVPVQSYLGRKAGAYRDAIAAATDKRISLMSELLNGIRVIKMYAWEKPFSDLVTEVRRSEINQYRKQFAYRSCLVALSFVNTKILIVFVVGCSYFIGGSAYIRSDNIFVITALFNTFRNSIGLFLPYAIQYLGEYKTTVRRIEEFLLLKEKSTDSLNEEVERPIKSDNNAVSMTNFSAKFSEKDENNVLENISFRAKTGDLVMIIGSVGSGKTTILESLCGDLDTRTSGSFKLKGQIVYVPQQAWIFPASVRQNVIFGGSQPVDEAMYKSALKVCALDKDLENFSDGDLTPIGDRGVALSGGQKARIALARAVYFDADVYLMDDPLSAVDATVGKLIFEKCINEHLKKKTRILVTNHLQYLKFADHVIVLKDGKIEAAGTYTELVSLGNKFTSILHQTEKSLTEETASEAQAHILKQQSNTENNDVEEIKDESRLQRKDFHSSSKTKAHNALEGTAKDDQTNNEEQEEKVLEGSMKWTVISTYFGLMGNGFVLCGAIIFIVCGQILFNFTDWWINIWVNKDDLSKFAKRLLASTNESGNGIINETCLSSMPLVANLLNISSQIGVNNDRLLLLEEYANFDSAFYVWTLIGSICLLILWNILRTLVTVFLLTRASTGLHNNMFKSLVRAPVWFFDKNPVGRILNRFSKDTGAVDELLSFAAADLIFGFLAIFGVLLTMIMLNPWVLIIMAPLFGLLLFLRQYSIRTSRAIKRLEAATKSPIYAHLGSTLNGLSCIRSMNAQEAVIEDFHRFQNWHTSAYETLLCVAIWFAHLIDSICVIFTSVLAFSNIWFSENQTVGSVGLSLFYAMFMLSFLQWIMQQTAEFENMLVFVERMAEYSNLPSEQTDQDITISSKLDQQWPMQGGIVFQNVKLKYTEESGYILKGLTFKIPGGQKIGIVGRTGAGKSSILNALFRMCKTEGLILIDGVDTGTIDLQQLRSRIGIIPQDPVLFVGTLRQNLDPFEEYSDCNIWRALDLVELKGVFSFSANTEGLSCPIQEGGSNLSVGQRQLICLARALLRKNKILVIDEATANVDLHTDMLIQKTIREQFRYCTVLTIAHRINTIMDSTQILVMDSGVIKEMDTPAVLLSNKHSIFAKLASESSQKA